MVTPWLLWEFCCSEFLGEKGLLSLVHEGFWTLGTLGSRMDAVADLSDEYKDVAFPFPPL